VHVLAQLLPKYREMMGGEASMLEVRPPALTNLPSSDLPPRSNLTFGEKDLGVVSDFAMFRQHYKTWRV
jgi:hypothetical protein